MLQTPPITLPAENSRRLKRFFSDFNPLFGDPEDISRFFFNVKGLRKSYLPQPMDEIPLVKNLLKAGSLSKFIRSSFFKQNYTSVSQVFHQLHLYRLKFDFPYWMSHAYPFPIDFKSNRSLIRLLQNSRLSREPIRLLILKYENLDITNVINLFLIWIKLYSNPGVNILSVLPSAINCKKVKEFFLDWSENTQCEKFEFLKRDFSSTLHMPSCDSNLWFIPASLPDNARGRSFELLYLSDINIWKNPKSRPANRIIPAAFPVVSFSPDSVIILESGPSKKSSFFFKEWSDANSGLSQFKTFIIPWYENTSCFLRFDFPDERTKFFKELWRYRHRKCLPHFPNVKPRQLLALWEKGLPLEVIHWYASESSLFKSPSRFLNAFPSFCSEPNALYPAKGPRPNKT